MIAKRYDDIETPVLNADILDMMCSFSEDSEHNIRNYSLNLFDAQNALIDFCRNFTTLEEIKRLEYDESFYRKMHFYLYMCGHPENGNTSDEPMEQKLYPIIEPYISTITKLLERIN